MLSFFRYMIFYDYIDPKEFYYGRKCKHLGKDHSGVETLSSNLQSYSFPWRTINGTFDQYGWEYLNLPLTTEDGSWTLKVCKFMLCNTIPRIIPI